MGNVNVRCFAVICVLPFIALTASCRTWRGGETGFLDRSLTVRGREYRYVVYVPRSLDTRRPSPVILFLHGSGERGTDGLKPTQVGLGSALREAPERVPAVVVFPQAPADSRWIGEPAEAALLALDRTIAEFHGDRTRLYLTGLSMGGYGVYHLALAQPKRFAALVIVCGGLLPHATTTAVEQSPLTFGAEDPYAFTARALAPTPIWLFHGDADGVIPVDESRRLVEALHREGSDVHYTEYAGIGHDAWSRAYREPLLWEWLFARRR